MYGAEILGLATSAAGKCDSYACRYGCESLLKAGFKKLAKRAGLANIMVLERGPKDNACTFVDKTLNAQEAGADALLIVNYDDSSTTISHAEEDETFAKVKNVTIPVGMILHTFGSNLEAALADSPTFLKLDWKDVIAKKERVVSRGGGGAGGPGAGPDGGGARAQDWEYWANSNDNCGLKCDNQKEFVKDFKIVAQSLEQNGWTQFTPHYLTWFCPEGFEDSEDCKSQCTNHGRYCTPDPDGSFTSGYNGKDVVVENQRQLCVYRQATKASKPWLWWDYTDLFGDECSMLNNTYDETCAERVFLDVGGADLPGGIATLRDCIGDADADYASVIMDEQQAAQVGNETEGTSDIVFLPTVVINKSHYVGSLNVQGVLGALCSAFDTSKGAGRPDICRCTTVFDRADFQRCAVNNGHDVCKKNKAGYNACKANTNSGLTVCQPTSAAPWYTCGCEKGFSEVTDVHGRTTCEDTNECESAALGIQTCSCPRCACFNQRGGFRCKSNIVNECGQADNGGCWKGTVNGKEYSACVDHIAEYKAKASAGTVHVDDAFPMHSCACPAGFDTAPDGGCKFKCPEGTVFDADTGICLATKAQVDERIKEVGPSKGGSAGVLVGAIISSVLIISGIGYGIYKYRMRSYMDSEIRNIMMQYMPLDKDPEADGL